MVLATVGDDAISTASGTLITMDNRKPFMTVSKVASVCVPTRSACTTNSLQITLRAGSM